MTNSKVKNNNKKKTVMVDLDRIWNENCLKTMSKMPDCFVDLVVTSPPYDNMRKYDGNNFNEFEKIAAELYRIVKMGGVAVWVISDQTKNGNESGTSFKHALYFKEVGFDLFDTMIYLKPPRGAVGNNKGYWQTYEFMFVLSKGRPKTVNLLCDRENKDARDGDNGTKRLYDGSLKNLKRNGYSKKGRRTNVWTYNVGNGHSSTDRIAHRHPAIFPEKLAEDHILSWSKKSDIVYDPFVGSGTTAKMAYLNNRNYIGSEISKDYYELAREIKDLSDPDSTRLKWCRECKQEKLGVEFAKNQVGKNNRIVRRPVCKDCYAKKKSINPKLRREYVRKHPAPKIGEKFTCPICQKSKIREYQNEICLDHNHKTGEIRGWICRSCNSSIGKFNEDTNILERAIKWLKGTLTLFL